MTFEGAVVVALVILGLGALVLLAQVIRSLVKKQRAALVVGLPLVASQSLQLPEAGAYDLWAEGRRLTSDFRGVDYGLADASGHAVPLSRLLLSTTSSGLSRVRMKQRSFEVPRGGSFTLSMTGLAPEPRADSRVIISRPLGGVILLHVLAIVATGGLLIGSVVALALVLSGAI